MPHALISLVIDAHLPPLRHIGDQGRGELPILFELTSRFALPLLELESKLRLEGIVAPLSLSLSPVLTSLWREPLCVDGLGELCREEGTPILRERWERIDGDLLSAFRELEEDGRVELLASAATHAFLPLLLPLRWRALQIAIGIASHELCFGRKPRGFFMPGGGYAPGLSSELARRGVSFSIAGADALSMADPRPTSGIARPIIDRDGPLYLFGADAWCREELGRSIASGQEQDVRDLARSFAMRCRQRAQEFKDDQPSLLVIVIDGGDLFGRRSAGEAFLEALLRRVASGQEGLELVTLSAYLERYPEAQRAIPAMSSLEGSTFEPWLTPENAWVHQQIAEVGEDLSSLLDGMGEQLLRSGLAGRAVAQALRELLCAQSSGWLELLRDEKTKGYAGARLDGHLSRAEALLREIADSLIDESKLNELERETSLFSGLELANSIYSASESL